MSSNTLPQSSQKIIEHYFYLRIAGKRVVTPYFINESYDVAYIASHIVPNDISRFSKRRTWNRALIGKGTPEELEKATYKSAKADNFNLDKANEVEIRDFMMKHGIGIECSGFVVWILNDIYKQKYNKPIWNVLKINVSPLRKLLVALRPVENISVKVLEKNTQAVEISNVLPGDLIISWNGNHVLLVSKVAFGANQKPVSFEYVNATWWYGKENGVRKGCVKIVKPEGSLKDQKWLEDFDKDGKNWTFEGIKNGSKLMRLQSADSSNQW